MFVSEISKEEINLLTIRHFGGKIHLIDTKEKFDAAFPQIMQHHVLGFDTETRPSFKKGKIYDISLIQLSSADEAWLIRINKIGIPNRLRMLMENKQILKIGAGLNDDFNKIRDFGSLVPGGFIDLQKFVEKFDIESKSLKKLTAIILGFKISKSQQLSNWDADVLSEPQKLYASTDAWVCYEIYMELLRSQS